MPSGPELCFNGINLKTGQYLTPPLSLDGIVGAIQGETPPPGTSDYLSFVAENLAGASFGLPVGVSPEDPRQSGWAIVFHVDEDPAVKDALRPLVEHRRAVIGDDQIVKVLEYHPGETHADWLARHDAAPGSIVPQALPYYLLLVGSPARIPFLFHHLLDVEYAVGRLDFDTAEEYARYAASVVAYETAATVPNAREAVFFASRHDFDPATQLSADHLVLPLLEGQADARFPQSRKPVVDRYKFAARSYWGEAATKAALAGVLAPPPGAVVPAVLFTASHGAAEPFNDQGGAADDARQRVANGALICQDWPGFGGITDDHYFSGEDVGAGANVHGLISFHFACYSAGTPDVDRFAHRRGGTPPRIARQPFVASLPRKLLAHPRGGALACIGHVERAWGYSIADPGAGVQIEPFRNALWMLMLGWPVGHALKEFNEKYAVLSTVLAAGLEPMTFGVQPDRLKLALLWTQRNDAEGFVVLGDPAARLRVESLQPAPAAAPPGP